MNKITEGKTSDRRRFLHKAAGCLASATLVNIIPVNELKAADTKPCSAELEDLKKQLHDRQFVSATATAWHVKKLREKFGDGVLEVVKNTTIENARSQTEKDTTPKEKRNLHAVREMWASATEDLTYTWVEDRPDRLQAQVTRCRWVEEMKKVGLDGEIGFAVVCCFDYGYCQGLNPAMKFSRTKTLMQGFDHCDHTYELKS